jgi:hypothetical protein
MLKPKKERKEPERPPDAADEDTQVERATGEGMPDPVGPADYGESDDPGKHPG